MANPKYTHPLDAILDRPVAFQRAFKTVTKNTVTALFLDRLFVVVDHTNRMEKLVRPEASFCFFVWSAA
jgi:hypothetical protein